MSGSGERDTQRIGSPRSGPIEDDTPRVEQEVLTIPPEWVGMKLKSNAELDSEDSTRDDQQSPDGSHPSTLPPAIAPTRPAHRTPIWVLAVIGLAMGMLLLLIFTRRGDSPPPPPASTKITDDPAVAATPPAGPPTVAPGQSLRIASAALTPTTPASHATHATEPSAPPAGPSSPSFSMPTPHPSNRPTPASSVRSTPQLEFVDPRSDRR